MSVAQILRQDALLEPVLGKCVQRGEITMTAGATVSVPCVGYDPVTHVINFQTKTVTAGSAGQQPVALLASASVGTSFGVVSSDAAYAGVIAYQVWLSAAPVVNAP